MSETMYSVEQDFKQKFKGKRGLKQKSNHECGAVLDFVPIVSRAGTDISAALDRLNTSEVHKPVILVVLHRTFDYEKVVPDSNNAVNRVNTFAVDCLFNEDDGMLKCQKNEKAYEEIARHLKSNKLTSYAYYKDLSSPFPSLDNSDTRDTNRLIPPTEDSPCLTHKYLVLGIVVLVVILVPVMLKSFLGKDSYTAITIETFSDAHKGNTIRLKSDTFSTSRSHEGESDFKEDWPSCAM